MPTVNYYYWKPLILKMARSGDGIARCRYANMALDVFLWFLFGRSFHEYEIR